MTAYCFTARVMQRKMDHNRCLYLAEQLVGELQSNPVLHDAMITVTPFQQASAFDIKARVECDGAQRIAVIMALCAAEEQWDDTLAEAGCEHKITHSNLTVWEYAE